MTGKNADVVACSVPKYESRNCCAVQKTETALLRVPLKEAALTHEVAMALRHEDPLDHFLAASAKVYGLTLVTSDRNLLEGKGFSVLVNR